LGGFNQNEKQFQMKIRIKGNSIRIRLTRSEVDRFGKDGYLEERTEFGNNMFVYTLAASAAASQLSASYTDGNMSVIVPTAMAQEWTTTDVVGFENNMPITTGKSLFILIEKDFKCIDNVSEDQSDNYEHPTLKCG
jgi:hypothetical protein